jgi:hypothetical protein
VCAHVCVCACVRVCVWRVAGPQAAAWRRPGRPRPPHTHTHTWRRRHDHQPLLRVQRRHDVGHQRQRVRLCAGEAIGLQHGALHHAQQLIRRLDVGDLQAHAQHTAAAAQHTGVVWRC